MTKKQHEFQYIIDYVNSDESDKLVVMRKHDRRSGKTKILIDSAIKLLETDNIIFMIPNSVMINHILNMITYRLPMSMYSDFRFIKSQKRVIFPNGNYIELMTPSQVNSQWLRGRNMESMSLISDECIDDHNFSRHIYEIIDAFNGLYKLNKIILN